jgi:hypothetical protein
VLRLTFRLFDLKGKRPGIHGMGDWVVVKGEVPDPTENRTSVMQPATIHYTA